MQYGLSRPLQMQSPFRSCDTALKHATSPWLWLFVVTTVGCILKAALNALGPVSCLCLIPHGPFCPHCQVSHVGSWPLHFSALTCPIQPPAKLEFLLWKYLCSTTPHVSHRDPRLASPCSVTQKETDQKDLGLGLPPAFRRKSGGVPSAGQEAKRR